jgi:hypothetical protein
MKGLYRFVGSRIARTDVPRFRPDRGPQPQALEGLEAKIFKTDGPEIKLAHSVRQWRQLLRTYRPAEAPPGVPELRSAHDREPRRKFPVCALKRWLVKQSPAMRWIINRREMEREVEVRTSLLDLLREHLHLFGRTRVWQISLMRTSRPACSRRRDL